MIRNAPIRQFQRDQLGIEIHESRAKTGEASAMAAAEELRAMLSKQKECSVVFASARSQDEFLACLRTQPDIDWMRVTVKTWPFAHSLPLLSL